MAGPAGMGSPAWWPGWRLAAVPAASGTAAVCTRAAPAGFADLLAMPPGGCPVGRSGVAVVGCFTVPAQPQSVAIARGFVARLLSDVPDAGTTVLLASELLANSVVHSYSGRTGAHVSLAVLALDGGLRVEVADDGGPTIPLIREPSELMPGGRGLRLVDALAARWGFYRTGAGAVTWFEVRAQRGR